MNLRLPEFGYQTVTHLGFAMARAFGDFCLKDFGLISVPEISFRHLSEKDEFIILASDGIWDVLSNKEVVDIVASCRTRSSAARALVETAVRAWRYKYPTSKVDDCAVVCLFFDSVSNKPVSADQIENESEKVNVLTSVGLSGTVGCGKVVPGGTEDLDIDIDVESSKEEEMNSEIGTDWSALEGVSRVNTLVNLLESNDLLQPAGGTKEGSGMRKGH